ncbi:MAG TPA: hypothetical protein VFV92_00540, partial [Candidatus Bathyarchaeia archaeon]|nr:hypothetical protein [Candidatus Bathyarchaeia archaeon]
MTLPSIVTVPRVFGANQVGNTRWSPFGPQEQNLIITVYGDFQSMFNAFATGQVDITDWPILPQNLGTGSSSAYCDSSFNPDYFCTTPTGELGIFDLQINSYAPVEGQAVVTSRATPVATIATGTNTTACDATHDSFTITLHNSEPDTAGLTNQIIKDQYNTLTVANSPSLAPSITVADAGGSNPTGTYNVPCQIAGTYQITSNIYSGSVLVKTRGGQNHSLTVALFYNSASTVYTTPSRYYWGAAIAHLLDRPSFVTGFFGPAATYDNCFDPADSIVPCASGSLSSAQTFTNADCHLFGNTANPVLHSWSPTCSSSAPLEPSAYNLVSDTVNDNLWWTSGLYGGPGLSGHDDIRAACDDLVS